MQLASRLLLHRAEEGEMPLAQANKEKARRRRQRAGRRANVKIVPERLRPLINARNHCSPVRRLMPPCTRALIRRRRLQAIRSNVARPAKVAFEHDA
jgi:hypothetical protein